MQFPNGVNKSNLIKLGVLGAAMYFMNNRNKPQTKIQNKRDDSPQNDDNQMDKRQNDKNLTPFQMGKALADKFLGRQSR